MYTYIFIHLYVMLRAGNINGVRHYVCVYMKMCKHKCSFTRTYVYSFVCINMCNSIYICIQTYIYTILCAGNINGARYRVATMSRRLKIVGLFCRIQSLYRALLQKKPMITRSLLLVASPYAILCISIYESVRTYTCTYTRIIMYVYIRTILRTSHCNPGSDLVKVYKHTYMYTYIYIYIRIHIFQHVHTFIYICIYKHVQTFIHIYIYSYITRIHIYAYIHIYVHYTQATSMVHVITQMCLRDLYIYTYTYTCIDIYIYMYITLSLLCLPSSYIHIYTHIYIYRYTHTHIYYVVSPICPLVLYIYTHIYTYIDIYIHTCITSCRLCFPSSYTYIHTHIYIYRYIHTHIYDVIYICLQVSFIGLFHRSLSQVSF